MFAAGITPYTMMHEASIRPGLSGVRRLSRRPLPFQVGEHTSDVGAQVADERHHGPVYAVALFGVRCLGEQLCESSFERFACSA
ncbi:hypothetical protein JHN53_10480 [Streptomyces sp. MBT58]|uniref:hypothetical protein n=1 Tax=Streptomyces sp. MBT58 TaxID=1488389 RepID=UPI0019122C47|nr:hypothetical protein [Streptomyces sp. MBT58]MBK5992069.1 hypothetical protein [Streptomyces sp. MBT58]